MQEFADLIKACSTPAVYTVKFGTLIFLYVSGNYIRLCYHYSKKPKKGKFGMNPNIKTELEELQGMLSALQDSL